MAQIYILFLRLDGIGSILLIPPMTSKGQCRCSFYYGLSSHELYIVVIEIIFVIL